MDDEKIIKSIIDNSKKYDNLEANHAYSANFKCNICSENFSNFDMLLDHINDSTVHEEITQKLLHSDREVKILVQNLTNRERFAKNPLFCFFYLPQVAPIKGGFDMVRNQVDEFFIKLKYMLPIGKKSQIEIYCINWQLGGALSKIVFC